MSQAGRGDVVAVCGAGRCDVVAARCVERGDVVATRGTEAGVRPLLECASQAGRRVRSALVPRNRRRAPGHPGHSRRGTGGDSSKT